MNTMNTDFAEGAVESIRQLTQSIKSLALQLEREVAAMRLAADLRSQSRPQPSAAAGAVATSESGARASKDAAREAADRALAELLGAAPPRRGQSKTRVARSEATRLLVRLEEETICRPKSADTFVEALRRIGLERVRSCGLQLCGVPLVSARRPVGYQNAKRVDGVYVVTHASNRTKKQLLERIARGLGVPIEVEVMR